MIKNYFMVALRNLQRNKIFSLINIGGLALGLAACWMITLYVTHEMSYDNYHLNKDRIYRLAQHGTWPGGSFHLAVTPPPMALAFKNDFPEVAQITRLDAEGGATISYKEQRIQAGDMLFADSSVFSIFSYHFLYGDSTALRQPQSIVLTRNLAKKLFGDESQALGKVVSFGSNYNERVTGVIENVRLNSHFAFSALRAMPEQGAAWGSSSLYTYVLLKEGAKPAQMEKRFATFFHKYLEESTGKLDYQLQLQPLGSIYLHSSLSYEIGPNGNSTYITIFSLVALLVLVIAFINYMNLSTARSSLRVKEIGIRKVSGSPRLQLVLMFLCESVLITFIASVLAILLINLFLPWFRQFTGKDLSFNEVGMWKTGIFLTLFSLVAGCLSGIYPALFLSGFKLIPALKGQAGNRTGNVVFRQSLVTFQFVVTICMIAGSFTIWYQLQFISRKDMGFNKDQVLTFHLARDMRNQLPAIRQQLLQNPLVEAVATAGNPIGNNNIGGMNYTVLANANVAARENKANVLQIDEHFIPSLQIKLQSGRNFMESMPTDKDNKIIVNETLVRDAGLAEPLGKMVQVGVDSLKRPRLYEIVAVVKDFNIYSLQHKVEPLILALPRRTSDKDNMYVRLNRSNLKAGLEYTAAIFKQFNPVDPFEFNFLDQNFARQYESEKMQGNLLLIFAVLAIAIACFGLFGLVTFTAVQRRKEIGIRKVLGGTVAGMVLLLAKDLMKLVIIAIVIATPLSWVMIHNWLEHFAYRISIGWWIFAAAGLLALLIAFLTISVQAIKAAVANPTKSLQTE